jgi:hypothetical protein
MKNKALCATIIFCGIAVAGAIGLVLGSYGVLIPKEPVTFCGTQLDGTSKGLKWRECEKSAP